MGDLVRTPLSEIVATLELLDRWGVQPGHLAKLRGASSYVQSMVAEAIIRCDESLFTGKHVITCSADPFTPNGWTVEQHRKGGIFIWDSTRVKLYLSKRQQGNRHIVGNDLRRELTDKPVLNANVLDYLLAHPDLIPEDWKGEAVFFWGTIYRSLNSSLFVRYVYWHDGRWDWDFNWLGDSWLFSNPAVLAS